MTNVTQYNGRIIKKTSMKIKHGENIWMAKPEKDILEMWTAIK